MGEIIRFRSREEWDAERQERTWEKRKEMNKKKKVDEQVLDNRLCEKDLLPLKVKLQVLPKDQTIKFEESMKIVATKIDRFDSTLRHLILPYISEERKNRIIRYLFIEDQIRSLVSELLLRISAVGQWGIEHETISFDYNDYGKPQFRNYPDFHFNISHSGQWVAIALDYSPVGIDIEQIRPIDFTLAKHFFTNEEIQQLLSQPIEYRINFFYKLWTLKESYIKAVGRGSSLPLQSFSFDLTHEDIRLQTALEDDHNWFFKQYQINSNYELAVSGFHKDIPEHIQIISLSSLISQIKLIE